MPRLTHRHFVVLLVACSVPKSSLRPDQLVAFGAREEDAATSIVIHRDGTTVGVIHWPDEPQQEHRGTLSADQLAALEQELRAHDCCKLEGKRVYAYADEPRVTLSIRWHDLDCEVQMWAQEWTELPRAKACRDAVQRFVQASE